MKTSHRAEGNLTIVEISGYLDFENAKPTAEYLDNIYKSNKNAQVLVDLTKLEFVGSSGISTFVKALRTYNQFTIKPTYFGVKNEFLRLFRVFEDGETFEIVETQQLAKESAMQRYQQWEMRTQRSAQTH